MNGHSLHNMYYVAIVCPDGINEKILTYKLWMQQHFCCIVALKSPAHITLIPPFYFDPSKEEALINTLTSFINHESTVNIYLNGFSHFGKSVIFVKVENNKVLEELYQSINLHFQNAMPGIIKKEERAFHPHVTIANRDVKPSAFLKAWEYFSKKQFETSFETNTISLLKLVEGKWKIVYKRVWKT